MFYDFFANQSGNLDLGAAAGNLATGVALPGLSAMRPVYDFVSAGLKPARDAAKDTMEGAVEAVRSGIGLVPDTGKSSFDKVRDIHHAFDSGEQSADDYEISCEGLNAAPTSEGREHARQTGMLQGLVDAGYDPSTPEGRDEIMGAIDTARGYDDRHGNGRGSELGEMSSLIEDIEAGRTDLADFDLKGRFGFPLNTGKTAQDPFGIRGGFAEGGHLPFEEPSFGDGGMGGIGSTPFHDGTSSPEIDRKYLGTGGLLEGNKGGWFGKTMGSDKGPGFDLGSVVAMSVGGAAANDLSSKAATMADSVKGSDLEDASAARDGNDLSLG